MISHIAVADANRIHLLVLTTDSNLWMLGPDSCESLCSEIKEFLSGYHVNAVVSVSHDNYMARQARLVITLSNRDLLKLKLGCADYMHKIEDTARAIVDYKAELLLIGNTSVFE